MAFRRLMGPSLGAPQLFSHTEQASGSPGIYRPAASANPAANTLAAVITEDIIRECAVVSTVLGLRCELRPEFSLTVRGRYVMSTSQVDVPVDR